MEQHPDYDRREARSALTNEQHCQQKIFEKHEATVNQIGSYKTDKEARVHLKVLNYTLNNKPGTNAFITNCKVTQLDQLEEKLQQLGLSSLGLDQRNSADKNKATLDKITEKSVENSSYIGQLSLLGEDLSSGINRLSSSLPHIVDTKMKKGMTIDGLTTMLKLVKNAHSEILEKRIALKKKEIQINKLKRQTTPENKPHNFYKNLKRHCSIENHQKSSKVDELTGFYCYYYPLVVQSRMTYPIVISRMQFPTNIKSHDNDSTEKSDNEGEIDCQRIDLFTINEYILQQIPEESVVAADPDLKEHEIQDVVVADPALKEYEIHENEIDIITKPDVLEHQAPKVIDKVSKFYLKNGKINESGTATQRSTDKFRQELISKLANSKISPSKHLPDKQPPHKEESSRISLVKSSVFKKNSTNEKPQIHKFCKKNDLDDPQKDKSLEQQKIHTETKDKTPVKDRPKISKTNRITNRPIQKLFNVIPSHREPLHKQSNQSVITNELHNCLVQKNLFEKLEPISTILNYHRYGLSKPSPELINIFEGNNYSSRLKSDISEVMNSDLHADAVLPATKRLQKNFDKYFDGGKYARMNYKLKGSKTCSKEPTKSLDNNITTVCGGTVKLSKKTTNKDNKVICHRDSWDGLKSWSEFFNTKEKFNHDKKIDDEMNDSLQNIIGDSSKDKEEQKAVDENINLSDKGIDPDACENSQKVKNDLSLDKTVPVEKDMIQDSTEALNTQNNVDVDGQVQDHPQVNQAIDYSVDILNQKNQLPMHQSKRYFINRNMKEVHDVSSKNKGHQMLKTSVDRQKQCKQKNDVELQSKQQSQSKSPIKSLKFGYQNMDYQMRKIEKRISVFTRTHEHYMPRCQNDLTTNIESNFYKQNVNKRPQSRNFSSNTETDYRQFIKGTSQFCYEKQYMQIEKLPDLSSNARTKALYNWLDNCHKTEQSHTNNTVRNYSINRSFDDQIVEDNQYSNYNDRNSHNDQSDNDNYDNDYVVAPLHKGISLYNKVVDTEVNQIFNETPKGNPQKYRLVKALPDFEKKYFVEREIKDKKMKENQLVDNLVKGLVKKPMNIFQKTILEKEGRKRQVDNCGKQVGDDHFRSDGDVVCGKSLRKHGKGNGGLGKRLSLFDRKNIGGMSQMLGSSDF